MDDLQEYPTFNGLSRSAMIWGIPIMALALIVGVSMIISLILMQFIGLQGFFAFVIAIPLLLMIKSISANDDQAINILGYEVACLLKKNNSKAFSGTNTILATKFGNRKDDYNRLVKENIESANRSRRLLAKNKSSRNTRNS